MSEGNSETRFLFGVNRGGQIGSNIVPDGAQKYSNKDLGIGYFA
jgi:hypothetical protein